MTPASPRPSRTQTTPPKTRKRRGKARWLNRLLKSHAVHWALSGLASLIMRSIYLTARVRVQVPASAQPYLSGEQPAIFCFWHGRMLMQPFLKPKGRPMAVLISQHNDGGLITATMGWFGIGAIRGSRKSGAAEAVRAMMQHTAEGGNLAITPDGPRGPFQQAAEGAAFVATKTGYPLLPIAFSAHRHWRFRSWDRFMVPRWFTRIQFVVGEPIFVDGDSGPEAMRRDTALLNARLNEVTATADALCGVVS